MCYEVSSKLSSNDQTQLGARNSTIQNSSQFWPFYYSCNENIVYRGYCEDWYSNAKYQFDAYQGNYVEVFDFDLVDRNIDLKYIPSDAVPVDIVYTPRGWRVYQHQPRIKLPDPPALITDLSGLHSQNQITFPNTTQIYN